MKQKILNKIRDDYSLCKTDLGLEKFFGDWYWTGKAATLMSCKNTKVSKLDYSVLVDDFETRAPSNLKAKIDSVNWDNETIFDIH